MKSSLDGLATNLDSTSSSLVNLLGQVDNSVKQISSVTGSASTDLSTVKEALEQTVSLLNESSEKLQKVSTTLSTDGSDGVQMLENILAEDPQTIGAFLAAPVSLNETKKSIPLKITELPWLFLFHTGNLGGGCCYGSHAQSQCL